jgi:hypothetical protein
LRAAGDRIDVRDFGKDASGRTHYGQMMRGADPRGSKVLHRCFPT